MFLARKAFFCRGVERHELWGILLEKAFAKAHGCYENLMHGYDKTETNSKKRRTSALPFFLVNVRAYDIARSIPPVIYSTLYIIMVQT